ncbi:hypothetical protein BUALT_Bualt01G0156400 [Buddleja alternifolia]|uniref:Uncharacterized protein n=1 Tax=Buddleja alternifolia TaxID=168488 RepID=A0AAV6YHU6_9LAMI|nr:hypothetical protein BUALT_Bualt01G0156400 [Buddleja alternifolia]
MAKTVCLLGAGGGACLASLVDNGSVESLRYYLSRRTLIEMLRDRGYVVANMKAELCRTLADFRHAFGDKPEAERLRLLANHVSHPSRKKASVEDAFLCTLISVYCGSYQYTMAPYSSVISMFVCLFFLQILVIFCGTLEIRKRNMVGILSQIVNKETLDRVILILQSKMNSYARKVLAEYPVKVETFQITELLVNITKHFLEPKHEILTPEEKQKLLSKYNIEDKQLPKMVEDDAIARYYGVEKGQVVKVTCGGAITSSLVTYRCVV